MVDTETVTDRRTLRFQTMADVLTDAEMLDRAPPIRAAGNWTAAQNVRHVADGIRRALDGFGDLRAPDEARVNAAKRRPVLLTEGFPAGVAFPPDMQHMFPSAEITWEQALGDLRTAIGRTTNEPMGADHPFLGLMTADEWTQFQCRHAELHFGFLHPADG